ncbi:hypothetical protein C8R43DRAFT_1118711 [Mycena crocata]|nr:hypothetical protein C8R43DRAFT_1118711 [Mycena crocata]
MSETAALIMSGTAQMMAMSVFWGIYALLFSISVFLLTKKGVRSSTPRQILLFSTCLMFAASTALASVDTAIYLIQFLDGDYLATSNRLQLACEVLFDSLFLMGDTIVLWRTWMLCPDRRLLVLFPIAFWFGGLSCLLSLIGVSVHNGNTSEWTIGVYDGPTSLKLSMATSGLSAATNFFSTLLITWKAWQRRALFNDPVPSLRGPGTRTRKIMSLLIESGFIYFGLWVIAMINFYVDWKAPALQSALRGLYDMVIGVYPTLVIILVHLDYTYWSCTDSGGSSTMTGHSTSPAVFSTIAPSIGSVVLISPDKESKKDTRW